MKHKGILITVSIPRIARHYLYIIAFSATRDKYSVKVPNGLGFSDFKGYESWQLIAVSHSGDKLVGVLGDPATVDAYEAGIPDNGRPSRMAPAWRRYIGIRKRVRRSPATRRIKAPWTN